MRQLLCLFLIYISYVHTQILFECNFDTSTENCFIPEINVSSSIGIPSALTPNGPFSDVTSSLKPTDNGEVCKLFYRIGTYTWDMYFCNRGYCPTQSTPNNRCQPGNFGFIQLTDNKIKSFQLKFESDGINGVNQQCLIYYYYMGNMSEEVITVRIEETNDRSEIIDSVTSSPFNGWIKRTISFNVQKPGYKIYFEIQKTSGFSAPYIAFDEISISQGRCDDRFMLEDVIAADATLTSIETATSPSISTETISTTTLTPHDESSATSVPADTSSSTTTPVPAETSSSMTTPVSTEISSSKTTPVPAETSSSTTTPVSTEISSSTTTPVPAETSSSTTTPVSTEISSSITTPVSTEISSSTTAPVSTEISSSITTPASTEISSSTTTPVPAETSSSTTTPVSTEISSSTTTPVSTEISSSITTPVSTEISSSITTPLPTEISSSTTAITETTYSDAATTEETTEFSAVTSLSSIMPIITTTADVEISTDQFSSLTATTIITEAITTDLLSTSISTEITSTTSIPSSVSDTTIPINDTTTISTAPTTTTVSDVNVVISSYDETLPYETSHIIIMATVIPVLWILFIVSCFWARRSTDIIGGILHPFNSLSRAGKTWGSYELDSISDP